MSDVAGRGPGSWWLRKAPKLMPGARSRAMGPGERPLMPRGTGQPPMGPSYYGPPTNTAAGGPSGAPNRNPVEPIDPYGWNTGLESQYRETRPDTPPGVIRDVDIGTNFFSPFQPILPFAPLTGNYAREWDYPVGVNLDYQPKRFALMSQLRLMSQSWGLLRSVIETRKDQLLTVPWEIQAKSGGGAGGAAAKRVKEFLQRPDKKRRFTQWARLLLEDLFVIDAPAIYVWRNEGGKGIEGVHALEVVDGATILPLVDDAGRIPDWPSPAYQQIIKGLPSINLTERELLYRPMRPRPELPLYGYSPVEQLYLEVTEGIRRTLYQVNFWTEGSMPELVITVPDPWTPQQIAMFQAGFDAMTGGNAALKSRVRFVPGGMKPFDIKNANGEALKSDYDEWLARLVCYTFSVSPQPFVKEMNRATAQVSVEVAEEEGTLALQTWFKDEVMDPLIQDVLGAEDLEFVWQPKIDVDPLQQAQVAEIYLKAGVRSINEVREEIGEERVADGDALLIYTAKGAVALEDVLRAPEADTSAKPAASEARQKEPEHAEAQA
ncbi:MAG: phage portal protein [Rhodospirillales bacterium]|nr:phage portal protein [Rhodospirillales bacterium]